MLFLIATLIIIIIIDIHTRCKQKEGSHTVAETFRNKMTCYVYSLFIQSLFWRSLYRSVILGGLMGWSFECQEPKNARDRDNRGF